MGYGQTVQTHQCSRCGQKRILDDLTALIDMGKRTYECRNSKKCIKNDELLQSIQSEKLLCQDSEYALTKYYNLKLTDLYHIDEHSNDTDMYYYYRKKEQLFIWSKQNFEWTVSSLPRQYSKYRNCGNL
jgi:hypothetical protein